MCHVNAKLHIRLTVKYQVNSNVCVAGRMRCTTIVFSFRILTAFDGLYDVNLTIHSFTTTDDKIETHVDDDILPSPFADSSLASTEDQWCFNRAIGTNMNRGWARINQIGCLVAL